MSAAMMASLSFTACQELDEPADTNPTVKTLEVSEIGGRKAYFTGTVNADATCYFLLATTINLMNPDTIATITNKYDNDDTRYCGSECTGLTPGTDYYVALCASDGKSVVKGNVVHFTTPTYLTIANVYLSDIEGYSTNSYTPEKPFGSFVLNSWSYSYSIWNDYANMKTTYQNGEYVLPQDISLSSDVRVYAYYPYTEEYSSGSIPVSIDGTETPVYLYGSSNTVNADDTDAEITLRHALVKVSLTISNASHEEARLTKVSLSSPNGDYLAGSGRMNVFTGDISSLQDYGDRSVDCDETMSSSTYTVDFMLIPTSFGEDQMTVKLNVDGRDLTTALPANTWSKGSHYTYQLSFTKGELTLGGIKVEDWDNQNGGSIDINQN